MFIAGAFGAAACRVNSAPQFGHLQVLGVSGIGAGGPPAVGVGSPASGKLPFMFGILTPLRLLATMRAGVLFPLWRPRAAPVVIVVELRDVVSCVYSTDVQRFVVQPQNVKPVAGMCHLAKWYFAVELKR
jgi:hypothetical protein